MLQYWGIAPPPPALFLAMILALSLPLAYVLTEVVGTLERGVAMPFGHQCYAFRRA